MKKSLLAYLWILLISWVLLELGTFALFSRLSGGELNYAALSSLREQRLQQIQAVLEPQAQAQASNVLYSFHPYFGFIGRNSMLNVAQHPSPQNAGEFVIAVTGGSVAEIFANGAEPYLRQALADLGLHRRVVLLNLAIAGYKQPQQLFHLEYALLAGFHFDAVLNLDGFNDLVLATNNAQHGIHPLYPSGSHIGMLAKLFASSQLNPANVKQLQRYYDLQRNEARVLRLAQRLPLRYSPFFNLLGQVWSRRSQENTSRIKYQIAQTALDELPAEFRGPPFPSEQTPYAVSVRAWQQASQMMHAVSRARGLVYLHALQPNQYLEGSKPLGEDEHKTAINFNNPWVLSAREGYPLLVKGGEELKKQGVPFYDMTQVFHSVQESLYVDDCCHFNGEGNRLLALALAPLLWQEIQRQGTATAPSLP